MRHLITDIGKGVAVSCNGGAMVHVDRYGVWAEDSACGHMDVLDTSDDLESLMDRYSVPADRVYTLSSAGLVRELQLRAKKGGING